MEGDSLSYAVSSSNENVVTAAISGTDITLTYVPNAHGSSVISLVATESGNNSNTATDTFNVSVSEVDDAATGIVTLSGTVQEGSGVTAIVSGIADVEDDDGTLAFTYQWQSSSDNSDFTNVDGATSASYTIPSDQTLVDKYLRVQVISTDSRGGTTTKVSASQQVSNVEDEATGDVTISGTVAEGSSVSADVSGIADVDDDDGTLAFSYQWQSSSNNSDFTNIDGATSSTYAIPSDQTLEDKYLRVQVISTDSSGGTTTKASASQQVSNVEDEATGDVTISGTVQEGSGVTAIVSGISDADDDDGTLAFTYQWQSSSDNGTFEDISGATSSSYTIPSDQTLVGKYLRVQVISTDSRGGTTTKSSSSQQVANVNDAPTILNALNDLAVNEDSQDTTINLANVFNDVDSDTLVLSAVSNNTNLVTVSVSGTTLTLSFVANANGNTTIDVTATEQSTNPALSVSDTFTVTVNAVNDTPAVSNPISNVSVTEDAGPTTIDLSGVFTDVESDTLSLTAVSNNTDLVTVAISGSNLVLTYLPNANGNTSVTVTATETSTDPQLSSSDTFNVTVNAVNDGPTVTNAIDDVVVDEDANPTTIDVSNVFSDVESDTLEITVTSNNTNLVNASISNNTLTLVYEEHANGNTTVKVTAIETSTNPALSVDDVFTVTVNPINDTPTVVNTISDVTVDEDANPTTINLTNVFSDVDSDTLVLSVSSNNSNLVTASINNNILTLNYVANANGSTTVTVTATETNTDPQLSAFDTFTVTVNPINDAPVSISLTSTTLGENNSIGTAVANMSVSDPDLNDTVTFIFSVLTNTFY